MECSPLLVAVIQLTNLLSSLALCVYAAYYIVHSLVFWVSRLRLSFYECPWLCRPREIRLAIVIPTYKDYAIFESLPYLYEASKDLPITIVIVDDSPEQFALKLQRYVEQLACRYGVRTVFVRRLERAGYKAGALNTAIDVLLDESERPTYILILDADHIVSRYSLRRLVRYLSICDADIVQGYQRHVRGPRGLLYLIYRASQGGAIALLSSRARLRLFPIFYGSTAAIRFDIANEIRFNPRSITEDFRFTIDYMLRKREFRIIVFEDFFSEASIPETLRQLVRQQIRWSAGTIRTFIETFRDVVRARHVPMLRKIDYVLQGLFFSQGLWVVMSMVSSAVMLVLGIDPVLPTQLILALWAVGLETILFTGCIVEGYSRREIVLTVILALVLINFFAFIHCYGTLKGLIKRRLRFEATRA